MFAKPVDYRINFSSIGLLCDLNGIVNFPSCNPPLGYWPKQSFGKTGQGNLPEGGSAKLVLRIFAVFVRATEVIVEVVGTAGG